MRQNRGQQLESVGFEVSAQKYGQDQAAAAFYCDIDREDSQKLQSHNAENEIALRAETLK